VTAVIDLPLRVDRPSSGGHGVILVLIGDRTSDVQLNVPTYRVSQEAGWRAMDEIHLV
jgi:hypothetical protein